MRIHRFYIENIEISFENTFTTQEVELIHQLKNVFRYKIGQKIHLFNEKVGEMEVEIDNMGKKDMSFKYIGHIKDINFNKGHSKKVTLYMSIIKNSNFDFVVEKAVELGVYRIVPISTERTIKNNLNFERLEKIVREATEQSGRVDLMKIDKVIEIKDSITQAKESSDIVYFGSITENIVQKYDPDDKNKNIAIFIGPEGGFSDYETDVFIKEKIQPVCLGKYVLRAETAAIVACGLFSL